MTSSVNNEAIQAEQPPLLFACATCGKRLRANADAAGTRVKCPRCREVMLVPDPEPLLEAELAEEETPRRALTLGNFAATVLMLAVVAGCGVYANLSFAVTNSADFKYFPPFRAHQNGNHNEHLGAEYFSIAKSLVAGEGFASPFKEKTGPTAWMPPILPAYLATLLWLFDGNQTAVMTVVIITQVATLMLTGLMVVTLAWQNSTRLGVAVAAVFFLIGAISNFQLWFQQTHDCWIVLLAMDIVVAGFCWMAPLGSKKRATAWGVAGGLCAMISPITGFAWGVLTIATTVRQRAWTRGVIALFVGGVALSPWVVRNYLEFGRLIPVKSNAAYELWQSQCLTPDGLLQMKTFSGHPWAAAGKQRQDYKVLGEMEFIDQKRALFWQSVADDPLDFLDRVACRGLGATLWYVPASREDEARRPWVLWTSRILHPLPCLALLLLLATAPAQRLQPAQWVVMGAYLLYLSPYIAVSYYDRYAMPLLAVKALLVIWAADRLWSFVWRVKAV
jgi:hypothetical protein